MDRVLKNNFYWFIMLMTILFIAFYLVHNTLQMPYIGLSVNRNKMGVWEITRVDDIGWAKRQGIKVGDVVSQVNGKYPDKHLTVSKYSVVEDIKTLEIIRKNQKIQYHVSNNFIKELLIYHTLVPLFILILLLMLSNFLYLKARNDKSTKILILFFLAIGFAYLSAGASSRTDMIARVINGITFLSIPVLFLEFLQNYFMKHDINLVNRKVLLFMYLLNGLIVVIDSFFMVGDFGSFYFVIQRLQLSIFSFSIVLCIYILISNYIRFRHTIHKPVLKIILFGMVLAFFPFVVLVALPKILFGIEFFPGSIAAVFLVFIPITFVYLLTAKRLFDIDFFINRLRYYSVLALLPTTFIVLLFGFLKLDLKLFHWINIYLITYLILTAFLFIKEELDFRFGSKLFLEKYSFQASLDKFSQEISKVMKISDLEKSLVAEVKEVIPVKSISLVELEKNDLSYNVRLGELNDVENEVVNWLRGTVEALKVGHFIYLAHGLSIVIGEMNDKLYLLCLGEKINHTNFNQDEVVWLKTIANYVSIVYENLHLIEGLVGNLEEMVNKENTAPRWILRLIFGLSEKERRRLASDLHDSVLQDQLLWYRTLEEISTDERLPLDINRKLNCAKEGLLDVIHQIRETCNELRPPFLNEMGIVEALENLFEHIQLRTNYTVYFDASHFHQLLEDEYAWALYRIVQELLMNAAKHSKASRVDIVLKSEVNHIFLNYRDNGIGMNVNDLDFSFQHMGLTGIKERVRSYDGEVNFKSTPGNGFEVFISLPLQELNNH